MAAGESAADLRFLIEVEGVSGLLGGVPVQGLFDEPAAVDSLGGYGVAAAQPQLRLESAAVPAQVVDMPLRLQLPGGERRFTVRETMSDGTGLTVLKLKDAL